MDERVTAAYEDRVRALNDTVEQRERELAILAQVASRVHGETEVQAILDIALAVERARHLQAERVRNQEARAMAAVSKAIGGTLDAEVVLKAVAEAARDLVGADRAVILVGEQPESVRVGHVAGAGHADFTPGRTIDLVAAGARLLPAALRDRKVYAVDDWERDD